MDFLMLGPLTVLRDGEPRPLGGLRQRAVLAALLLNAGRDVEIDRLIDDVWHDAAPRKPVLSLRAYVANLRRILGADLGLTTGTSSYCLDVGNHRVDARDFEDLIERGRRQLDSGDAEGSSRTLQRALGLWRGTPLSDLRNEVFVQQEVHRLETLRADAVEARFEAELRLGRAEASIAGLALEVAANPMREPLSAQLMVALYRAGRRSEALRAYAQLAAVLDEELGVRPGLPLQRLAEQIRDESPDLDWRPARGGRQQAPRDISESALHGRSAELHRLRAALTAAAAGRGSIAVLTGDSGVGKTALATETARAADGLGMSVTWAGHAGDVVRPPMWAWNEVIGQASADPDESGAHAEYDLAQSTARAVAAQSKKTPTVVVLDDLHRADGLTCDVLELLSDAVHRVPLLILATWQAGGDERPLREDAFDRLLSRAHITLISLRGIDAEATAVLIRELTGIEPTPEFTAAVRTRTGGNPFYIGELVRLLHDSERLDATTRVIEGDDVPDAVSGIVRRRMADLPDATRRVLTAAAVTGMEFPIARLATALQMSAHAAAADLEPALAAGLLRDSTDQFGAYRFSHGLVRDAIASQIAGVARAELHAELARAHAAASAGRTPQETADGALHAWRAGGALDPHTALALIDGARRDAWTRSMYAEVAELDRRALEVCARLPADPGRTARETDLRMQLASVEAVVNGQSSMGVLEDLRRSSEGDADAEPFTVAVAMGCLEACGSGRYHEARVLSDGLIAYHESTGDGLAGSAGHYIRALAQFMRGQLDPCVSTLERLWEHPADWERYGALASFDVIAYGVGCHAYALRGDLDAAESAIARGVALGGARNDGFGTAVVRTAAVQLSAMLGNVDGLAQRADQVLGELTELGVEQFIPGAQLIRGWALATGPDGIDTTEDMHDAIAAHARGGRRIFSPLYYALLSDVESAHRDRAQAVAALDAAERISAATGERVWDAMLSARRLALRASV
ncbi:AAA family ATPase [Mycobacterium manitobense]|uniref:AAA family ATPase n=1 Tax=[Mycobacterium] manitobense TaxID=190147 RepID=A0A9X3BMD3_9MYCO|nr:BTAD domain-containing putative transcriptional regulator [[Mycobacterium] manitobense]MCV7169815.1 AAA family ATPase [[Mycobacterium] manitobense]